MSDCEADVLPERRAGLERRLAEYRRRLEPVRDRWEPSTPGKRYTPARRKSRRAKAAYATAGGYCRTCGAGISIGTPIFILHNKWHHRRCLGVWVDTS